MCAHSAFTTYLAAPLAQQEAAPYSWVMSDLAPLADPQISPELKAVIHYTLHDDMQFDAACTKAGLNPYSVIATLDEPHVREFIKRQGKVRVIRARLRNVAALERIRDASNGSAAVAAIRTLEELLDSRENYSATVASNTPGVTINIISGLAANSGPHHQGQHVQGMTLEHDPHAIEARAAADSLDHPDAAAEPAHDRPGGKNER